MISTKQVVTPLAAVVFIAPSLVADSTFDSDNNQAWGSNTGWTLFRHDRPTTPSGVVFGESFLSGFAYSSNLGWINFGNGTPINGHTYSNNNDDHGVNHDGTGNLSGFAWSANTGWINFGWASKSDDDRPRVDLTTGAFSGFAWSANTGWFNLGGGGLVTREMDYPDSDEDGIADHWEHLHFGDLTTTDGTADKDDDGVLDRIEYLAMTDPDDLNSYLKAVVHVNDSDPEKAVVQLTFTTTPKRLYRIEHTSDLGSDDPWKNSALGTFPATGAITTKTLTLPSGAKQFFRIVPVRPLTP